MDQSDQWGGGGGDQFVPWAGIQPTVKKAGGAYTVDRIGCVKKQPDDAFMRRPRRSGTGGFSRSSTFPCEGNELGRR